MLRFLSPVFAEDRRKVGATQGTILPNRKVLKLVETDSATENNRHVALG